MIYRSKVAAAVFRQPDRGVFHQRTVDRADRSGSIPLPNAQREELPSRLIDRAPASRSEVRLAGQVLSLVAIVLLSFLIELTVLGNLQHDRDQTNLAEEFRSELANAVAPVGPLDDANKPVASGAPVALLEIPKLRVREIVGEGTSAGTLMSGPGHRRDTPLPGQVGTSVIAGRRATYGAPFRSIGQLRAGDQITVTTGQGRHVFKVLDVRHAGDPLPPALSRGQGRLTLVTTDGPALAPTDVLRVDTALVSAAQSRPAQMPSQALPAADALLAGDSSVLLDAVGWTLLLVAAAAAIVWVRFRTGLWQAWVIGVPVLVTLGLTVSDEIAALLPNLL
jgi:LPXTG-site transpeptidase (sortase) family protein